VDDVARNLAPGRRTGECILVVVIAVDQRAGGQVGVALHQETVAVGIGNDAVAVFVARVSGYFLQVLQEIRTYLLRLRTEEVPVVVRHGRQGEVTQVLDIGLAAAVVILAVANNQRRARIDRGIAIVAIGALVRAVHEAISIAVGAAGGQRDLDL